MTQPLIPLVTMVLICYNQQTSIDEAVAGALSQDYSNLEIVISDDASTDDTFARISTTLQDYSGPHQVKLIRNLENLGIGGNLDQAVRQSHGELIFIAAGDDVSLPHRVSTVVNYWLGKGRRPNLIAAYLNDMDSAGNIHDVIPISDLSAYSSVEDWSHRGPPHVIGAAQAWTRRMFDQFGGIPKGVVGEDMVMAFRAIATGSATTLPMPLVNYRRGGITSHKRSLSAAEVIRGLTRKLKSSQIELRCLLKEAREFGATPFTLNFIERKLNKEVFIESMFAAPHFFTKFQVFLRHREQPFDFKVRILAYATAPWLMEPFFYFKRWYYRN